MRFHRFSCFLLLSLSVLLIITLIACSDIRAKNALPSPSPQPNASGQLTPTTTLQAETSNNTSAPDTFGPQPNGNAGAGNVSKQPIASLLYAGSGTKILAHWLGWFGGSNHMNVGYRSDDPAQVRRQVDDMVSRGIQGAIIDWFGASADIVQAASTLMKKEAEAHAGFQFAIMEDAGALFNSAVANGCDVTDQLISDLGTINSQFVTSPAYLRIDGKPVIFMFGVSGYYIDWQRVLASLPSNTLLLFRGGEGLQQSYAGGAFQWVDINSSDAFDPQTSAQDAFYNAAVHSSGRVAVGSVYKGFYDPLAAWGTDRQIHQRCGQTWLDTFSEIGKFYSANNQLPALQIVTWNDYEEGSAIESGIDNCAYVVPSISGTTLNWTLGGGPESTVDHYTVFGSTDGQNLAKLADVPAGTLALDLSALNLPSSVSLFVKAVGRPSIRNVMSAPVAFRAGDRPPNASLSVTQAGDLTVTASTSGSSDPDGSLSSTAIDFGDGTVMNDPSATHTYKAVGTYTVTATVVDNAGASSVAVARVEAKAAASGVTILAPGNSATVNWPTSFVASANTNNAVTRMRVLIDGEPAFASDQGVVNTALKVFTGTHHISVEATDASGAVSSAAVDVLAEPEDIPPTAVLTVRALPNVSPTTVLACSVASHDPDGFILTYKEQFSDGAVFFTPAAVHTLASPGSYSVSTNVTDQFGAPASQTQAFAVSGSASLQSLMAEQVKAATQKSTHRQFEPIRRP